MLTGKKRGMNSTSNYMITIDQQKFEKDGKGYAEDRRPNANCDPYVVSRMITDIVCGAASKGKKR